MKIEKPPDSGTVPQEDPRGLFDSVLGGLVGAPTTAAPVAATDMVSLRCHGGMVAWWHGGTIVLTVSS